MVRARTAFKILVASSACGCAAESPTELVERGAYAFEAAGACSLQCSVSYVNESVRLFEQAKGGGYPAAELWQLGISLYYADRFEDGSVQFRSDVAANPNDTEESVWAFASEAQTVGFEQAREQMLLVANETRPYMSTIYSLFRGDGTVSEAEVAEMATDPTTPALDAHYYAFYLGFFEEAKGDAEKAQMWISRLASSEYAKSSVCTVEDYVDCVGVFARVHAQVRGWVTTTADELVEQGDAAFEAGSIKLSLQLYDQAIKSGFKAAILWQRGISLYYVGGYEDGSQQFHDNYEVLGKHHDAEESVWAFICEAQLVGFEQARRQMLVIMNETRPYMQNVYELFRGDQSVDQVEKLAFESPLEDAFYYALYLGLFEEAAGNTIDARAWMTRAASSEYVTTSGDFMGACAVVHAQVRGWDNSVVPSTMTASGLLAVPADEIRAEDFVKLNLPTPIPRRGEVLIKLAGASVNPFEVREAEGKEGSFEYPHVNGNDFAGTVIAMGPAVSRFQVGDRVWGLSWFEGAHAEYLTVTEDGVWGACACMSAPCERCDLVGHAPSSLSLAEAAVMPIVAMTNLFGFQTAQAPWPSRDKTVVVLGGSGGIGHLAIQLAKAWGASTVITTCGTSNLEFCKSMGADRVIDYHEEDWHSVLPARSVDLVYDAATQSGTGSMAYDLLKDGGYFVTLQPWPLANETVAKSRPSVTQKFIAMPDALYDFKDLDIMRELVDSGKLTPHIQRTFSLAELGEAFIAQKAGHTVGKNSIRVTETQRPNIFV